MPLVASFPETTTVVQHSWLCNTTLPLRKVLFHRHDGGSAALLVRCIPKCDAPAMSAGTRLASPRAAHCSAQQREAGSALHVDLGVMFPGSTVTARQYIGGIGGNHARALSVRVLHTAPIAGYARLTRLSRFASLRALTLCRVFGDRDDPGMTTVLCQLPVSLEVRCRRYVHPA